MKFKILNRWSGDVIFTADIEANEETPLSIKVGLAVKWSVKNKANLSSADLSNADLSCANLRYANLRSADLSSADLSNADLSCANLRSADLHSASLRYANLRSADLRNADLRSADLRSADLSNADLSNADLSCANLHSADLHSASLRYANLRSANLSNADLHSADLRSADLRSAVNSELAIAQTRILPEGSLIGWKKCRDGVVVKLRIPEEAKRSHAFGRRKCRAEFVDTLEVVGAIEGVSLTSSGPKTIYRAGERVHCHEWCEDFTNECAGGIHFFITRQEAEEFTL